jgi:hypothetical protein
MISRTVDGFSVIASIEMHVQYVRVNVSYDVLQSIISVRKHKYKCTVYINFLSHLFSSCQRRIRLPLNPQLAESPWPSCAALNKACEYHNSADQHHARCSDATGCMVSLLLLVVLMLLLRLVGYPSSTTSNSAILYLHPDVQDARKPCK